MMGWQKLSNEVRILSRRMGRLSLVENHEFEPEIYRYTTKFNCHVPVYKLLTNIMLAVYELDTITLLPGLSI